MSKIFTKRQQFFSVFSAILIAAVFLFGIGVFGETRFNISLNFNPDLQEGLVGYWTFDADSVSGVTVNDLSTAGNNASIVASTATVYSTAGTSTYEVPAGITSITVKVWGGGGGSGGADFQVGGAGGGGGFVTGTVAVTPGETLTIVVGDGGSGGCADAGSNIGACGGGGGGYSAVRNATAGGAVTTEFLFIASGGGGGGGGDDNVNGTGTTGGAGGAGGGTSGVDGTANSNSSTAGGGGTDSAGGTAGDTADSVGADSRDGTAGESLRGGLGGGNTQGAGGAGGVPGGGAGGDPSAAGGDQGGGGGGGAGYFGGGGGGTGQSGTEDNASGGGGGSSFSTSTASSVTNTAGSGASAGNNGDADYAGSAGQGGAAPVSSDTAGSAGNDGRVVLLVSDSEGTLAAGRIGQGVNLDGEKVHVDAGNVGSGVKTVAFWFNAATTTFSRKLINIDGTDQIELNGSARVTATSFPAATVYVNGSSADTAIATSTWYHVVVTDTTGVNASDFEIGRVGTDYFGGVIDDVRVYNRVLSEREITRLYQLGATTRINVAIDSNPDNADGLVAHWGFDAGSVSATTISDQSGQGNDATATGAAYAAIPLNFDGTNDYLTRGADLTGVADGKAGTISAWLNLKGGDGANQEIFLNWITGSGVRMTIRRQTDNTFLIFGRNSAATTIMDMRSSGTYTAGSGWVHLLASWDLAAGAGHVYVNGVDDRASGPTLTNDTLKYTADDWVVGANGNAALLFNGDMADVWFDDSYIDITSATNRAKFINQFGGPVDLGANCATPTGSQPLVCLSGTASSWETNDGSGGGFTENGALTDGTTPVGQGLLSATVPGRIGQALEFDGVDDYVKASDFSYGDTFSVAFWFRVIDNSGSGFKYLFSHGTFDSSPNLNILMGEDGQVSDGLVQTCYEATGTSVSCAISANNMPTAAYDDGKWHHYALTVNSGDVDVYIDGERENGTSSGGGSFNPSTDIYLGARSDLNADRFHGGGLDDIRLYNRPLSASEVQRLYQLGATTHINTTINTNSSLENSLEGHWTFDGKHIDLGQVTAEVRDSAGTNHGDWQNHGTTTVPGRIGQALDFDGTDDHVEVSDSSSISFGNGSSDSPFTVSAWVNMDDATRFRIVDKSDGTNNEWGFVFTAEDTLEFYMGDSTLTSATLIGARSSSAYTSDQGQWVHLLGTYDGSESASGIKLYRNGVLISSSNPYTSGSYVAMHDTVAALRIGADATTFANGKIDDVRVYSRALSASEIERLYQLGR